MWGGFHLIGIDVSEWASDDAYMEALNPVVELRSRLVSRTQQSLAEELGFGRAYIANVLGGRKPASPRLLDALGLERRVVYVRKRAATR